MRTRGGFKRKLALLLTLAVSTTTSGALTTRISHGEQGALTRAPSPIAFPFPTQAVADFDGDYLPDRAELISNGFRKNIHLRLSSPWTMSLHFSSETQQPGSIYADDIDRDSDNDLIWVSDQQAAHTALWLNNGIGELARVSGTGNYAGRIKRLVDGGSRNGSLATSVYGELRATAANEFYFLALPDNQLPEVPRSASIKSHCLSRAAMLSPCISRYPKRGPPSFLS